MKHHVFQFLRYGCIGVLNTALSLGILNLLMHLFNVSSGHLLTLFSAVTFAIVITHSFFWNKFLVFRSHDLQTAHREYVGFFVVSGAVALFNIALFSLIVNGVGPQWGIAPRLWANVAVLLTIPTAVLGNFFGYKLLVFSEKKNV